MTGRELRPLIPLTPPFRVNISTHCCTFITRSPHGAELADLTFIRTGLIAGIFFRVLRPGFILL
jgi:hypothetical protein